MIVLLYSLQFISRKDLTQSLILEILAECSKFLNLEFLGDDESDKDH